MTCPSDAEPLRDTELSRRDVRSGLGFCQRKS